MCGKTEELHKISWSCFFVLAYKSASHFEVSTVFSKNESERQLHSTRQLDTVHCSTVSVHHNSPYVFTQLLYVIFHVLVESRGLVPVICHQEPHSLVMFLKSLISPDVNQQCDSPCAETDSCTHSSLTQTDGPFLCRTCENTHTQWDVFLFRSLFP